MADRIVVGTITGPTKTKTYSVQPDDSPYPVTIEMKSILFRDRKKLVVGRRVHGVRCDGNRITDLTFGAVIDIDSLVIPCAGIVKKVMVQQERAFITPDGGGRDVFLKFVEFTPPEGKERPWVGAKVVYEIDEQPDGRHRAKNARMRA